MWTPTWGRRQRPAGVTPGQGQAYLSGAAGVVLGLGGGPEQAGGHGGRPQLQDPAEVRGVGGGAAGGGGRRRVGLLALGQAELLGSPGRGQGAGGRSEPSHHGPDFLSPREAGPSPTCPAASDLPPASSPTAAGGAGPASHSRAPGPGMLTESLCASVSPSLGCVARTSQCTLTQGSPHGRAGGRRAGLGWRPTHQASPPRSLRCPPPQPRPRPPSPLPLLPAASHSARRTAALAGL